MCDCKLCKRSRKFDAIMNRYKFRPADKKFLDSMYESLCMVETDYEVDEAILAGQWPEAKEILTRALSKIKSKENKI